MSNFPAASSLCPRRRRSARSTRSCSTRLRSCSRRRPPQQAQRVAPPMAPPTAARRRQHWAAGRMLWPLAPGRMRLCPSAAVRRRQRRQAGMRRAVLQVACIARRASTLYQWSWMRRRESCQRGSGGSWCRHSGVHSAAALCRWEGVTGQWVCGTDRGHLSGAGCQGLG